MRAAAGWSDIRGGVGRHAERLKYVAFFLVLFAGAYNDSLTLFSSPAAVGLDGYYYVLQVDGLSKGKLLYPAHAPLVFYYLTGLRFLTGDTVDAIKAGTIILEVLLCLGIGLLLIRVTGSWWLGALGAGYAAFAGLHYFMIGEFVNNLGALALIVAAVFCFESARRSTSNKRTWLAFSLVSLLAAAGSHRSTPFLLMAVGLAVCWAYALRRAARARNVWALLAVSSVIPVLYFVPYLALVQTLVQLPGSLAQELSTRPHWPVTPYTIFDAVSILWAAPLILAVTIRENWKQEIEGVHLLFPGLAFLGIIVNLSAFVRPDLIAYGVLGRLQTLMYLQVALLVPYAIHLLRKTSGRHAAYAVAFSIPLLALGTHTEPPSGLRPQYLRDRERLIKALPSGVEGIAPGSLIVAPHGDQFVITSATGIAAQNSWPKNWDRSSVYWMLRQFPPDLAKPPVKPLSSRTDGSLNVLVRDDDLGRLWGQMSPGARQRILLGNFPLKSHLTEQR